jgi:chemotaxis family two-component system sensor kinase Cph1
VPPESPSQNRQLSDLLLRACHDLRAPVRAIRAHTELLLRDAPVSAASAERFGFIVDGAKVIDRLLDGLSNYSLALRIDPALFRPTSMDLVLRNALHRLEGELRATDCDVTHGELPRVMGDLDRLIDLMEHLLRNALIHRGSASPRIRITAAVQDEAWVLAVSDNGPGIDADCLETIFQPFVRAHDGQARGAGMGLAICRVIAERHGGRIWAVSKAGDGATFLVALPAVS